MRESTKTLFVVSVFFNAVLVAMLVYVGGVRTDYFQRIQSKIKREPFVPKRADGDCVYSWNNCIAKLGIKRDVVFFGNSITAGGDFQRAFPELTSINMGYVGDDIKGMLRRVETMKSVEPSKVFLMAGINGLKSQEMEDFRYWYGTLVDSVRAVVPGAELFLESILPVGKNSVYCENDKIKKANAIISQIASERGLVYVDLFDVYAVNGALAEEMTYDGLHLREEAYGLWYKEIKEYMEP